MKKTYDVLVIGPVSLDHNIDYQGNGRKEVGGAVVTPALRLPKAATGRRVYKLNRGCRSVEAVRRVGADVYWKPSQATCSIRNQYFTADKEKRACTPWGCAIPSGSMSCRISRPRSITSPAWCTATSTVPSLPGSQARQGGVDVQCLLRHVEADGPWPSTTGRKKQYLR